MKNIPYILFLLLILYGCEKVIDVNLNEAAPAIVIEGNLSSSPTDAEIKISMTSSFFDSLPSEKVSGALVTVTSDFGDTYNFKETERGIYKSKDVRFKEGSTYNMYVEANGEKYEAASTLHFSVGVDSLKFYYQDSPFFDPGYYVKVYLLDPAGVDNFYRIKYLKNGVLQNTIDDLIIFNDRFVDGSVIEITLFNQPFELNDTIKLQLISLDESAYNYLQTFADLVNSNPGSAAPANPVTNISNDALGYFSVWSSNIKTAIIKTE